MTTRVLIFLFSLLLTSYNSSSQPDILDYLDSINNSNSEIYYKRAKHLSGIENIDSLDLSSTILSRLQSFNSKKYPWQRFSENLKKIAFSGYSYYTKKLIGSWRFDFGCDSLKEHYTSKTKKLKLVFTKTQIFVYENDVLKRQMRYLITNKYVQFPKNYYHQIYLPDSKKIWGFGLIRDYDVSTKIYFSENNSGLCIYEAPSSYYCPQSCYVMDSFHPIPEEEYARLIDSIYNQKFDKLSFQKAVVISDTSINTEFVYKALFNNDSTRFIAFYVKEVNDPIRSRNCKSHDSIGYATDYILITAIKRNGKWYHRKIDYLGYCGDGVKTLEPRQKHFFTYLRDMNFFEKNSINPDPNFWEQWQFFGNPKIPE